MSNKAKHYNALEEIQGIVGQIRSINEAINFQEDFEDDVQQPEPDFSGEEPVAEPPIEGDAEGGRALDKLPAEEPSEENGLRELGDEVDATGGVGIASHAQQVIPALSLGNELLDLLVHHHLQQRGEIGTGGEGHVEQVGAFADVIDQSDGLFVVGHIGTHLTHHEGFGLDEFHLAHAIDDEVGVIIVGGAGLGNGGTADILPHIAHVGVLGCPVAAELRASVHVLVAEEAGVDVVGITVHLAGEVF